MSGTAPDADTHDAVLAAGAELAKRVLANIEKMHPQFLAMLLERGDLARTVRRRIDWYKSMVERLRQEFPNEPANNLSERSRDCLGGTNRNWEGEKPLTGMEKQLLAAFREKHHLRETAEGSGVPR
jgi:hypothetical protein